MGQIAGEDNPIEVPFTSLILISCQTQDINQGVPCAKSSESGFMIGQKMQVRVNADYLFGAPAAGLDMRWSLRRTWGYFSSKRFPGARFSSLYWVLS